MVRVSRRVEWRLVAIVVCPLPATHRSRRPNIARSRGSSSSKDYQPLENLAETRSVMTPQTRTIAPQWLKKLSRRVATRKRVHTISPKPQIPFASLSTISGTFNSLFKVLFIFPSWYLCAIGPWQRYFALDDVYHPLCVPIPRNATLFVRTVSGGLQATRWALTLVGAPFQETCARTSACNTRSDYNSRRNLDASLEHFPVHSPLLGESCLVTFPPLTYMLKFGRWANFMTCLTGDLPRTCNEQLY